MNTKWFGYEMAGIAASAAALTVICMLAWMALGASPLPRPASASAPAPQFSAQRAFVHVQELARAPRPIATPANAQARRYIVGQLRAIGLSPEVHTAIVQKKTADIYDNTRVALGVVHNVVVRIAGTAPDHERHPALLLAAHYDSAENTLGAADGAASAAAMLETARALRSGAPPKYDVVLLFADGEKVGSLGMHAFVGQHPQAHRVGLALKFDNPGSRGPLVLYDTSRASSEAIAGWARATDARGSSLMRELYKLSPHMPGIGPLAELEAPVLQLATVEGVRGWYPVFDTPDRLDRGTLQHEGETMLSLARHYTQQPLGAASGAGQVYFALPPLGVVHYSMEAVWPFTRLTCLLLIGVCCLAAQRANIDALDIAKGAFGFALAAGALPAVVYLLGARFVAPQVAHDPAAGDTLQLYLPALAALHAAVFICLQRGLQKTIGTSAAVLGALVWIACALLAVSWFRPAASYLLVWPLLAAATAAAALLSRRVAALPQAVRISILCAGLAPGVILVVPAVRDAFALLAPDRIVTLALMSLLLGLGTALLAAVARRYMVRALAVASLGCFALTGNAGASHPPPLQPNPLVYYKDMPTWRAWWLARPPSLDGWTRQLFPNLERPRRLVEVFGWDSDDLWYAPAGDDKLAFPYAILLKNDGAPRRRVEFELTSKNRAPHIRVWIKGGNPRRTVVNGRVLTDTASRTWLLSLYGMQDQLLRFSMDMVGDPAFRVHVEERIPGIPEHALSLRIDASRFMPGTGTTVAADTLWFH